MAADTEAVVRRLREELVSTGYGAIVQEDALSSQDQDRSAEQALEDLIERLRAGVVTAMQAHAASIRNLGRGRQTPRRGAWEPPPSRISRPAEEQEDEFAIKIDDERASRIEADANELADLLSQLRASHANEP